jgi:hypothetical protein
MTLTGLISWIARVMGHRDTDMVIRVYGKYIENAMGCRDGESLNKYFQGYADKDD